MGHCESFVDDAATGNPRIHYLGFRIGRYCQTYEEVQSVDFSIHLYEGLPLTILEAFSTGTLVIAIKAR